MEEKEEEEEEQEEGEEADLLEEEEEGEDDEESEEQPKEKKRQKTRTNLRSAIAAGAVPKARIPYALFPMAFCSQPCNKALQQADRFKAAAAAWRSAGQEEKKKYEQKSAEEFAAQRAAMAQRGIPCKRRGVKGNRIGGETPVCDTASYRLSEPAGSGLCEYASIDAGEYTWTAQAAHICERLCFNSVSVFAILCLKLWLYRLNSTN